MAEGEVHVSAFALDVAAEIVAAAAELLTSEERRRADQFRLPGLRERYIIGRAAMRRMVAEQLGVAARELCFTLSPRGKPSLPGAGLHFNLAHSGGLAVLAVTRAGEVGVDVERIRPMPDALDLAARFFSPRELAALRAVPPAGRDAAFFRLWTRKEAWLKATGDGIAESLAKIEVEFRPEENCRVLAIGGDAVVAAEWCLQPLEPAAGYVGALAIRRRDVRVVCRTVPIHSSS